MTGSSRGVAWLLAAWLASAAPLVQARDWIEARIDDFVLVTDARESYARTTLRDFAVFKHALGVLAPLTRGLPRMPTRMFALDSGDWRSFAPGPQVAGYFTQRPDANYIVFDRTPVGLLSREVVFHEYMHFVLNNGSELLLPAWWDEGVAEVFSSLAERDGKVDFGLVPRARNQDFVYFELMPTAQLFSISRDSPAYRQHGIAPMFYAQSWLTAHYFLIARPDRGRQANVYLQETSAGMPVAEAVQSAFGISLDELDREIRVYRLRGRIGGYRLTFSTPLPDAGDVVIRPLPQAVALARLALAGLTLGRSVEDAQERAQRALQLDPGLPLAQAALANVRQAQQRDAEAADLAGKALSAASAADAAQAAANVEWWLVANALRPDRARPRDDATVEELIDAVASAEGDWARPVPEQVARLQAARKHVLPFAADADYGLGATLTAAGIDGLLGDRKPEDTLALIQQATTLYPTHPELAELEARLCVALGRNTAALASASRAARYARSPEYRRWLEQWVAELEAAADSSR